MQWLMGQLGAAGCAVEQRRVASVQELAPAFDVVVNCAGGRGGVSHGKHAGPWAGMAGAGGVAKGRA